MNTQLSQYSLKRFVSLAGVASMSLLFTLPAFALVNTADNSSNHTSHADSTGRGKALLAQQQGGAQTPSSGRNTGGGGLTPAGGNTTGGQSPMSGGSGASPSSSDRNSTGTGNERSLPPEKTPTGNKPGPAGQTSLQPGSWFCLNNPNPQCRS